MYTRNIQQTNIKFMQIIIKPIKRENKIKKKEIESLKIKKKKSNKIK